MTSLSSPVWTMALLACVMATKHYIADFILQTDWIARGKDCARGWLVPLAAHVAGHAAFTLAIALIVAPHLWWLAFVEFAVHFAIDRGKGLVCLRTRLKPNEAGFWWVLGFDQYLHQVTNVLLAAALLTF